ncbi:MAG: leukotriene A4 hydrolase C-terminal domain-containing protein, partial [Pseudomonadota bacterium]
GRLFVEWLEARYGRERFDVFLRDYFNHFAFQSISTEQFIDYLAQELIVAEPGLATLDEVREWIFEPGLPAFTVTPESDAFDIVDNWRERWLNGEIELDAIPTADWSVAEWRQFFLKLSDRLNLEQMAELDAEFDLTHSDNVEILYLWLVRSIETRYEPGIERLEQFLLDVGRNKFIRPLYQELADTDWGRDWAIEIYQRARPGYHSLTRQAAERVLDIEVQR